MDLAITILIRADLESKIPPLIQDLVVLCTGIEPELLGNKRGLSQKDDFGPSWLKRHDNYQMLGN